MQIGLPSDHAARIPWANLRIPSFPQIAIRVLQLTSNEDVSMRQLGDLISSDPSFSSEVLTIANSALYAPRAPVTSILQAIVVLGLNSLKGVCLTVGVRTYLGKSLNFLSSRAIWRHSLACALIAERLAQGDSRNTNTAYTGGVLHDIGRLAMVVNRCDAKYSQAGDADQIAAPAHRAGLVEANCGHSRVVHARDRQAHDHGRCRAAPGRVPLPISQRVGQGERGTRHGHSDGYR